MNMAPDSAEYDASQVYDGHGGRIAADYAKDRVLENVLMDCHFPENIAEAMVRLPLENVEVPDSALDDGQGRLCGTGCCRVKENRLCSSCAHGHVPADTRVPRDRYCL